MEMVRGFLKSLSTMLMPGRFGVPRWAPAGPEDRRPAASLPKPLKKLAKKTFWPTEPLVCGTLARTRPGVRGE